MLLWHTEKLISCSCIFWGTVKLCRIQWCSLHGLFLIYNFFKLGQSYEIRMLDNRKMGDMPEISGKLVKVRTVCFSGFCGDWIKVAFVTQEIFCFLICIYIVGVPLPQHTWGWRALCFHHRGLFKLYLELWAIDASFFINILKYLFRKMTTLEVWAFSALFCLLMCDMEVTVLGNLETEKLVMQSKTPLHI